MGAFDRRFGVELEFGPDENLIAELQALADKKDSCYEAVGFDWLAELLNQEVKSRRIGKAWVDSLHEDGSLWEISSPPLRGPSGIRQVQYVMELLRRRGCCCSTEMDGFHVHLEAPDFAKNHAMLVELVRAWRGNMRPIYSLVNQERALWDDPFEDHGDYSTGGPCPPWRQHTLEQLEQDRNWVRNRPGPGDLGYNAYKFGRRDLNLSSLKEHGTIEIRLHEGTLDGDKAEAWIRFGQAFLHTVATRSVPQTKSVEELLSKLRLRGKHAEVLLASAAPIAAEEA